ncbi:MAG: outer membrane lipoprotein-sorting protein [Myxococcota bacterium]
MKRNQTTPRLLHTSSSLLCIAIGMLAVMLADVSKVAIADENTSGVPVPQQPNWQRQGDPASFGRQIATYADRFDAGWIDSYSQSKMTLFDAGGDKVTRDVRQQVLEGTRGDKSLVRFMTPADIRGVAALTHEHPSATDDSWLYLPATRRVRRVSGANRTASFQGTEFTYEDLSSLIVSRYEWRFLSEETITVDGEQAQVYRLEARPTYENTGYAKIIIDYHKEYFRVERMEYYDRAGQRLKTLVNSRWKRFHGRFWRAMQLDMNNYQTGKRTLLESRAFFVNLSLYNRRDGTPRDNLNEQQFTRRALENG